MAAAVTYNHIAVWYKSLVCSKLWSLLCVYVTDYKYHLDETGCPQHTLQARVSHGGQALQTLTITIIIIYYTSNHKFQDRKGCVKTYVIKSIKNTCLAFK